MTTTSKPAAVRGHRTLRRSLAVVAAASALVLAACSSDSDEGSSATTTTASTGSTEGGTLELLTYNVAGLPQEISDVNPKEHMPLISPLLDDYDVVLTQEDFDWYGELASTADVVNYHDRLRKDVSHEHRSPAHPGPEAVDLSGRQQPPEIGDGLGYLSKPPMEGNVRVPWTHCFGGFDTSDGGAGDCLAMKGFAMSTMTLGDGLEVDVYNLHAEAGGSDRDQELQGEDVRQLAAYIREHSKGRAVIVAGDTNLHTGGEHADGEDGADTRLWNELLEDAGLTDACDATDCPDPTRIDKVAYRSSDDIELEVTAYEIPSDRFKDDEGTDLSDHEPVAVTIRWNPA